MLISFLIRNAGQLFDSQQRSEKLELDLARAKDEAGMLRKHLEVACE